MTAPINFSSIVDFTDYVAMSVRVVEISTNTFMVTYVRTSNHYLCAAIVTSTGSVATPVVVHTQEIFELTSPYYGNLYCPHPCKIRENHVAVAYVGVAGPIARFQARHLEWTGSVITDHGQKFALAIDPASDPSCCYVNDDQIVFSVARPVTGTYLYPVTISGTTWTWGGMGPFIAQANDGHVFRVNSTKCVAVANHTTGNHLSAEAFTINWSTRAITSGALKSITAAYTGNASYCKGIAPADDNIILLWGEQGNSVGRCVVCTISGTTITPGSILNFNAAITKNIGVALISETSVVAIYADGGDSYKGTVQQLDLDFGTRAVTDQGTPTVFESGSTGGSTDMGLDAICSTAPSFLISYQDDDNGDYGKVVSGFAAVSPPSNVAAVEGSNQGEISISWDPVVDADSYNLYWSTSTGVTQYTGTKITSVTSPYVHVELDLEQEYFYVITSVDESIEGVDSAEVSSYPLETTLSFTATAGDSENVLTWNAVDGATSYDIYWELSSGVTSSTGTKISSVSSAYTHEQLSVQPYYYILVSTIGATEYSSSEVYATPVFEGKIFTHNDDMISRLLYQYQKD